MGNDESPRDVFDNLSGGITASSIAVGIVAELALATLFEPYFANTAFASGGAGVIIAFAIINLLHLTHGKQTRTTEELSNPSISERTSRISTHKSFSGVESTGLISIR